MYSIPPFCTRNVHTGWRLMAWQLVVEVFDHAPADLTAAEMTVLLALADWSPVESRETSRPMPELARRARLSKTGLRAALRRLSARGLEVRVPIRDVSWASCRGATSSPPMRQDSRRPSAPGGMASVTTARRGGRQRSCECRIETR